MLGLFGCEHVTHAREHMLELLGESLRPWDFPANIPADFRETASETIMKDIQNQFEEYEGHTYSPSAKNGY